MAEKEQRIWFEYDIPKPKGAVEAFRCTTMTRKEAIKKISSHLLMCDISTMDTDEIAKAALNALLEEGEEKDV
jgi:hypothetical protein